VDELVDYLLANLQLDFSGDVSAEQMRQYLRDDDGREARKVLGRLLDDDNVEELLITLADCLKDHIQSGIRRQQVLDQLSLFSDS
jgi:hypothetical protein